MDFLEHPALQIAMRYVHIVSAIAAVGGLIFLLLCLKPSLRLVDDAFRAALLMQVRLRFEKLLLWAIFGLTVSGVYNWYMLAPVYKAMGPKGNALIGTKVLLAMIMFAIVAARRMNLINDKTAQLTNIHLAAAVILFGSVLRYLRMDL